MKKIIVRTPKEEQFYEVIEFYREGKDNSKFRFLDYTEKTCLIYDLSRFLSYSDTQWLKENMPTAEIITFEQWRELVGKKESVSNELIQDIDLDIDLLELARKLVTAGRIKDGTTLSIIAGNSMKEKLNK